jgi:hypothetical protein
MRHAIIAGRAQQHCVLDVADLPLATLLSGDDKSRHHTERMDKYAACFAMLSVATPGDDPLSPRNMDDGDVAQTRIEASSNADCTDAVQP